MSQIWTGWILFLVFSFVIFEGYALSHDDGLSLSQYTVNALYAWPPLGFLLGLFVGMLVTHFFWHWVPKQKIKKCEICGQTILIGDKG